MRRTHSSRGLIFPLVIRARLGLFGLLFFQEANLAPRDSLGHLHSCQASQISFANRLF